MAERTSHAPGTISWADLATNDQDAAKAFYSGLFGWEYDDQPVGDGVTYSMAQLGGRAAAAINPQQPDEAAQGIPPHWNVYVTVEDADAKTAEVTGAGGQVLAGPFDVFDAGRMAVIADPTGAVLSLWQAGTSIGAEVVNVPSALTWADCASTDPQASAGFYSALLGWRAEQMSEEPPYWVLWNGERTQGGLTPAMPGAPSVWFPYFAVESVDAKLAEAQGAGATPAVGPIDVPQGRFAIVMDPQGAVFALFEGEFDD